MGGKSVIYCRVGATIHRSLALAPRIATGFTLWNSKTQSFLIILQYYTVDTTVVLDCASSECQKAFRIFGMIH